MPFQAQTLDKQAKALLEKRIYGNVEDTSMVKLYGEFSILVPARMVPGLMEDKDFLTPSGGLQNGSE